MQCERSGFLLRCSAVSALLAGLLLVSAAADSVPGIASAVYDAQIGSSLPGIIGRVLVKPGDAVKAGDLLIEFESIAEDLEVTRRELVWQSKSALESGRHRLATISNDVVATRNLFTSSRSVSEEELEMKELELKLAEAQVRELEVGEQREKIELEMAREQARRRRIAAPVDGTVIEVFFEKGEYVQLHDPLLRLVDVTTCHFTCNIGPRVFDRVTLGSRMTIEFAADPEPLRFEGTVVFVSALVDPASGLKDVRLKFENRDGTVSPGAKGMLILE